MNNFTPKYNWKPTPTEETSRYKSDNKSFTYLWDNYFLFDHTFAEKHRVGLMAEYVCPMEHQRLPECAEECVYVRQCARNG